MSLGLRFTIVVIMLAMGLTACVSLSDYAVPLSRPICPHSFVAGHEVQATLTVRTSGREDEFFLAMRTRVKRTDIAILSPQGIPFFSIQCSGTGPDISRQVGMEGDISPLLMLTYLELMFMDEGKLRHHLVQGWNFEEGKGMREFFEISNDRDITISYKGSPPWFTTIRLEDRSRETTLVLKTVEVSLALPE
jgi:hypothetical protein